MFVFAGVALAQTPAKDERSTQEQDQEAGHEWGWFKDYIQEKVQEWTGRKLTIGDLDIEISATPLVIAKDIAFENAQDKPPHLLEMKRLEFRINSLNLLEGNIVVPEITMIEPRLVLENYPGKGANWKFINTTGGGDGGLKQMPMIQQTTLKDGKIIYRETGKNVEVSATLDSFTQEIDKEKGIIRMQGEGQYEGQPLSLMIKAGFPQEENTTEQSYPLDAEIDIGDTVVRAEGTVKQPFKLAGLDVDVYLKGPGTSQFAALLPASLNDLPAYRLEGNFTTQNNVWHLNNLNGELGNIQVRLDGTVTDPLKMAGIDLQVVVKGPDIGALAEVLPVATDTLPDSGPNFRIATQLLSEGQTWRLKGLEAQLGDSEISASMSVNPNREPLQIQANLTSSELDLAKLADLAPEEEADDQIIPDTNILTPEYLHAVQGSIDFSGEKVVVPNAVLRNVDLELTLENGQLKVKPLQFQVVDGTFTGYMTVYGQNTPIESSLYVKVDELRLQEILAKAGGDPDAYGTLQGQARLRGTGRSPAAIAASADGNLFLIMRDGRMDSMLAELMGLDAGEALMVLMQDKEEPKLKIRCAVADFAVINGIMKAKTLVIDTVDTKFVGGGTIDLGKEIVDLALQGRAKDFSLLSADAAVYLSGDFTNLSISTDVPEALLSALTPIELGLGEDADCQALIDYARQDSSGE